jgi:hypothetical protein
MSYTIAYVMSLPHSGSTLCGALLGAHSRAFPLGEPWKLRQYAHLTRSSGHKTTLGNACTCGAPSIWDCAFWPRVDREVRERAGLSLRDLDTASTDPARFARDNALLFDAVAAVTGASLLVDSSKRPRRLAMLRAAGFAPVTALHLLRDPRGQVFSTMKRSGRGPYRHAVRNALDGARLALAARGAGAIPVRYERLAADPEGWLREIMPRLGLAFEPGQLDWARQERHNLSGNRSRATRDSTIRADRTAEAALTPLQKAYIDLIAGPVARFAARGPA